MRYLARVGLMSTLLIGGVLGGLTAPLPSEAVGPPTLTLQIDGQTTLERTTNAAGTAFTPVTGNSILGAKLSACSTADRGLGYTDCYAILTSTTVAYRTAVTQANPTTRLYRIQNATGATARLRVGDNLGQDNFSLVGVQFVPVNTANQATTTVTNWTTAAANTNEQHVLQITMRHKFDNPVNMNNATGVVVGSTTVGQVAFGMASGGEFRSAPLSTPVPTTTLFCTTGTASARCNAVGDNVTLTGMGIFSGTTPVPILSPGAPTAPNSNPLSLTVGAGNANSSIVGYAGLTNATMGQVNPEYPKFDCIDVNAPTKCQPDITLTLAATLKGPETFVMLNGGADGFCSICNFGQDNTRLTRLFTFLSNVIAFLDWWENNHADNPRLRAFIDKAKAFLAGFNGPPADSTCAGATYIQAQTTYEGLKSLVTIAGDGGVEVDPAPPAPATGTITITKNTSGPGGGETDATFNFNISGPSPSTPSIPMGNTNSGQTDVITVNAGTYSVTEVNLPLGWTPNPLYPPSCSDGEITFGTKGFTVPSGGNITCTFSNRFIPGSGVFNGHEYRVISLPNANWGDARAQAQNLDGGQSGWDLATITSAGEQIFINSLLGTPPPDGTKQYWIGGEQQSGAPEPGGNWQWINGEGSFWNTVAIPGQYSNWGNDTNGPGVGVQPDNAGCCPPQNHLSLDNRYGWAWDDNDQDLYAILGYVAERVSP